MHESSIQDATFDRMDFTIDPLAKGEYENCKFNNCNFADCDISGFRFADCTFIECNLSLAKINRTTFQDVTFKQCKMLGLRFDTCHGFGLSFAFEDCQLNHSSFYKLKMRFTVFRNSQLQETDFSEADLTSCVFDNCSLTQASFDHTILENADLRTSHDYSIDPESNRIRKAKFSVPGLPGLLQKYDIEIEG